MRPASGVDYVSGQMVTGVLYDFRYNAGTAEFLQHRDRELNPSGNLIAPSGTIMPFGNATAPTGWTKSTSFDDAALRIVAGTPGSGGSNGFSSMFTNRTISQANLPNYTLPVTDPGDQHSYQQPSSVNTLAGSAFATFTSSSAALTGVATTGITVNSGGSGTPMDFRVK